MLILVADRPEACVEVAQPRVEPLDARVMARQSLLVGVQRVAVPRRSQAFRGGPQMFCFRLNRQSFRAQRLPLRLYVGLRLHLCLSQNPTTSDWGMLALQAAAAAASAVVRVSHLSAAAMKRPASAGLLFAGPRPA